MDFVNALQKEHYQVTIEDLLQNLFDTLNLPKEFLTSPPKSRAYRNDYKSACKIVCAMKVVNDCAEWAVKLATDFNKVLTKNDNQRQLLYQVVEYHRKHFSTEATKKQLSHNHSK